jgi:hypothetical protein
MFAYFKTVHFVKIRFFVNKIYTGVRLRVLSLKQLVFGKNRFQSFGNAEFLKNFQTKI